MGDTNLRTAFLQLHLSVLLAGFTGLFGKLITLNEVTLTWYRLFFTTAVLVLFIGFPKVSWKKFLQIAGNGTLLGLHWILFYASIKASNVSIGVVSFASLGFFTSIFEPLVFHRRISVVEMLLALITVAGLVCIFSFDSRYRTGIILGVISAAVCSLYSITNKIASEGVRSRTVLLYQMAGGLLGVTVIIPVYLLIYPSTAGDGLPDRCEPVVDAVSGTVLHGRSLPPADHCAEEAVRVHRQPYLQS